MSALRASLIVLTAALSLMAAACSAEPEPEVASDPKSVAEAMITSDLATQLDLGPLTALCNDPGPLAVGTAFACTATTASGDVVQIDGEVDGEGRLALTTTNLVSAAALPSFEREAAANLNNSIGSNFTAEAVDCGDTSVVLAADFAMGCALRMPASQQVFDMTLTITDLDGRRFDLVVADAPRS